jgi:hypothetical protein
MSAPDPVPPSWAWDDPRPFVWKLEGAPPRRPLLAWLYLFGLLLAPPLAFLPFWGLASLAPGLASTVVSGLLGVTALAYGGVFVVALWGQGGWRRFARAARPYLGLGLLCLAATALALPGSPWADGFRGAEEASPWDWFRYYSDLLVDTLGFGLPHLADLRLSAIQADDPVAQYLTALIRFLIGASVLELIVRLFSFRRHVAGTLRDCYREVDELSTTSKVTVECVDEVAPLAAPERATAEQVRRAYRRYADNAPASAFTKEAFASVPKEEIALLEIWPWNAGGESCWTIQGKQKFSLFVHVWLAVFLGLFLFIVAPYCLYPLFYFPVVLVYALLWLGAVLLYPVNWFRGGPSSLEWAAGWSLADVGFYVGWVALGVGLAWWLTLLWPLRRGRFKPRSVAYHKTMGAIGLLAFFVFWAAQPGCPLVHGFRHVESPSIWRWGLFLSDTLYDTVFLGIPHVLGLRLSAITPGDTQSQLLTAGLKALIVAGAVSMIREYGKGRQKAEIVIGSVRDVYYACTAADKDCEVKRVGPLRPLPEKQSCPALAFLEKFAPQAAAEK